MAYSIKFTHPAFDKGEEFDLTGVGLVENGSATKMDADQERYFISRNGMSVKDYFKDSEMVEVTGTSELKAEEIKELLPPEEEPVVEVTPATPEGGGES